MYYKKISEINNIEELFKLGESYYEVHNYPKAIAAYKKAVEIDPTFFVALGNLGATYFDIGEHTKAIECWEQVIKINPIDHKSLNNIGYAYEMLNELDKALEYYKASLKKNPNYKMAKTNFDATLEKIELNKKDISKIDNAEELFGLGMTFYNNLNYTKAIECWKKTIKIKSDDYLALSNIGYAYETLGEIKEAIKYYQESLKIKPDFELAQNNLKAAKSKQNIKKYKIDLETKPDDHTLWNKLAKAYDNIYDYDEAIKCYKKALEIDPTYETAQENLNELKEGLFSLGFDYSKDGDQSHGTQLRAPFSVFPVPDQGNVQLSSPKQKM